MFIDHNLIFLYFVQWLASRMGDFVSQAEIDLNLSSYIFSIVIMQVQHGYVWS